MQPTFEQLAQSIRQLKAPSATLTEERYVNWFSDYSDDFTTLTGTCSMQDLKALAPIEQKINATVDGRFLFELEGRVGECFPVLTGVERVGYQNPKELILRPGEVTLMVLVGQFKVYQPTVLVEGLQRMLDEVSEQLTNKFRAVVVWDDESIPPRETVERSFFMFEHWEAVPQSRRRSRFAKRLLGEFTPLAYLIGPDERIATVFYTESGLVGGDFGAKLVDFVNERKAPPESFKPEDKQAKLYTLDGYSCWEKFEGIVTNNPDLLQSEECKHIQITGERKHEYREGRITCRTKPLKIWLPRSKSQQQLQNGFVQLLRTQLHESERDITKAAPYGNVELKLIFIMERITHLRKRHNIKTPTSLVRSYSMDILNSNAWTVKNVVGSLGIPYSREPDTRARVSGFVDDLTQYKSNAGAPFFQLEQVSPFKVSRVPFAGIQGLDDYTEGTTRDITHIPGILQFVFILCKEETKTQDYDLPLLQMIAEAAERHSEQVLFHVISVRGRLSVLTGLLKEYPMLKGYLGDKDKNADLHAMYWSAPFSALLVHQSGEMLQLGQLYSTKQIERLIHSPELHDRGIPFGLAALLRSLPQDEKLLSKIRADVKSLPYVPSVSISFDEEYSENFQNLRVVRRPTVKTRILEEDRWVLQPLFEAYELDYWGQNEVIPLAKMPEHINCLDCSVACEAPFYYFYNSASYRCLNCTEAVNTGELEKLLRYNVAENSVLVLGSRYIKHSAIKNIPQRINESLYKKQKFYCRGCSTQRKDEPCYRCVECEQQNIQVKLCINCVRVLTSGPEQLKDSITAAVSARYYDPPVPHKKSHNLHRITLYHDPNPWY